MDELEFREVRDNEDILELVRLQKEIWGFDDLQLSPPDLLKVHQHLGGTVFGVFRSDGTAVAFCYSFCGILNGEQMHWSHMLGVSQDYRGRGIGERLKWMQRDHMLRQNITLCQWTWDPLEPINSYINLVKLGVISSEYEEDVYGITSGPLHGGLPTDRFVANWRLDNGRVERASQGKYEHYTYDIPLICNVTESGVSIPVPDTADLEMEAPEIAYPVIKGMMKLKFEYPAEAMAWRKHMRTVFKSYFNMGYVLCGAQLTSRLGEQFAEYILEKSHEN